MRNKLFAILLVAVLTALFSGIAAASSFFGNSGNIMSPNDVVLGLGEFNVNFHQIDLDDSVNTIGVNVGITEDMEIGGARYDSKAPNGGTDTILNMKYRLLPETANRPSVVLGGTDITGEVDTNGDPSLYVVFGKSLTKVATDISGEPSKPVRGYIGAGSGMYDGFFIGAEWSLSPKVTLVGEFLSNLKMKGAIDESSVFNAGAKLYLLDNLGAEIDLINADDLAFGVTFSKSM